VVRVETAAQMLDAVRAAMRDADVLVMAAAVADARPESASQGKLKKDPTTGRIAGPDALRMVPTTDVLADAAATRRAGQVLVGFAAETPAGGPALEDLARAKLARKGVDLVVANDTVQNFVFTNRHDGTFQEVGAQSGVAFDAYGQTRGAMGIDAARFRPDRALGIAIGNFANEMNALYVAQPAKDALVFADEAITEGIGPASRLLLKFGLFFFDYDLDGRLDVLTTNGHIEEEIEKVQSNVRYRQPAQLFWNGGGNQTFISATSVEAGDDLFQPIVGRGSAHADFDQDGDPDVVMTQIGGPPLLLRNDQALGNHWVRLRLVGRGGNPEAIGAWIHLKTEDGRRISRQVMPTKSYLSQSELPLHLGLGRSKIAEARIRWPDGSEASLTAPLQQTTILRQQ